MGFVTTLDPDDPVVRTATFGRQVEDFLGSDIGKYLVGRAEQEADEAMEKLKCVAPWRRTRIRDLQAQIWRAESFQRWLGNAIVEGQQALGMLEDND